MPGPLALLGQVLAYAAFAVMVGYFSMSPAYTHLDPAAALIKLSFSHAGERKEECRRYTQEELDRLAPNMRRPMDCPRERIALYVELELDGELIYRDHLVPTGVARDGASTAYRRFVVQPGRHHIAVRLRDTKREQGFDWERSEDVDIRARQNFVIDFRAETGGFRFL